MATSNTQRSERNPDKTRQVILQAAFMEIYRKGYQGMRLDSVLAEIGMTKGALYHHFSSKQSLGYAVVDEVIQPMMASIWEEPLNMAEDPLDALAEVIETLPDKKPREFILFGCPLNNLIQEMSPQDSGFRKRLDRVMSNWHTTTKNALIKAQEKEFIRADIDCNETATFIMAALEGCIGIAKSAQSVDRLRSCLRGLTQYLQSLEN
jgi:AcrR family transcriptional regulator